MINKEIRRFLKEKKFVIGVPMIIKFKIKKKLNYANFKASKGTEVIKYSDVLKILKLTEKTGESKWKKNK